MSYVIEKDWITKAEYRAVIITVMWDEFIGEEGKGYKRHYCGYVEIPQDHPLFYIDYDEPSILHRERLEGIRIGESTKYVVINRDILLPPLAIFDVHGGLTHSSSGIDGYPVESDGWWFGFDCAHYGDVYIEVPPTRGGELYGKNYWTVEMVAQECEKLAQQLKIFAHHAVKPIRGRVR
ncbi:hypothetical protein [Hydrogenivirga sp.]